MTYVKILVLVMMVIAVIGCGAKDPLTSEGPGIIMPLKIGNTWTYDLKAFYAPNQPPSEYYVYYITVIDTVLIDSELWYTTTLSVPSAPLSYTVYYANRSDGLYMRVSTAVNDSVYLRFKYPAHVGDTCHTSHEFFRTFWGMTNSLPAEIKSTNVSVQVPYDTLGCYNQYTNYDPGNVNPLYYVDDFFRPNLGMMRSNYMVYDATHGYYPSITWELTAVLLQ